MQSPTICVDGLPVEPTYFVILRIGVIVAMLGSREFVTSKNHRRATRQEYCCQHVSHLAEAKPSDLGVVSRAFNSMIPGDVVGMTVPVSFPIRVILLVIVGDEIAKRKAVMGRDEIN